jgi:hypothetical protein
MTEVADHELHKLLVIINEILMIRGSATACPHPGLSCTPEAVPQIG